MIDVPVVSSGMHFAMMRVKSKSFSYFRGPIVEDMLNIQVKEGDNIERALKQFKKKFDQTKTMKELRTRREFVKPSVLNREMKKKAVYKNLLNTRGE